MSGIWRRHFVERFAWRPKRERADWRRPGRIRRLRMWKSWINCRIFLLKIERIPGNWPLGCMYHSRNKRRSCSLAKSGSRRHIGIIWKAKSHDAYFIKYFDYFSSNNNYFKVSYPGIFPFVWNRDDIFVEQVSPVGISTFQSTIGRLRLATSNNKRFNRKCRNIKFESNVYLSPPSQSRTT